MGQYRLNEKKLLLKYLKQNNDQMTSMSYGFLESPAQGSLGNTMISVLNGKQSLTKFNKEIHKLEKKDSPIFEKKKVLTMLNDKKQEINKGIIPKNT